MTSPERLRSYLKQDDPDLKFDDDWEGDDKRKYRSSKPRSGNNEEAESLDSKGRKRSTVDRNESRKRSGGSSKADIDEDDYDAENDLRSKLTKKKQGENTLETLSNWYQDGELGGKYDNGDKTGDRGQFLANESVRRKSTSRFSDGDGSQTRNIGKNEKLHGGDSENALERDSRRLERKDTKEKDHVLLDSLKNSNGDKDDKYPESDETKLDCERNKKGRSYALEEDNGGKFSTREDKLSMERVEEHRQLKSATSPDIAESRERSVVADGGSRVRERNRREMDSSDRSRTPERSGRRRYDSESVEMEYEERDTFRRKEQEKDGVRDDKSKGRDDGRNDRNRVRDGSKDGWKRRQGNFVDREMKDGETPYEHGRDWEIPRRGWIDNERPRSGGRKDGNRTEALKTSSKYGISNENYDVIEIQTRPFDYGREEAVSSAARTTEVNQTSDAKSLPDDENYAFPREGRGRNVNWSGQSGQDLRDTSGDGSYRDETESRAQKGDASVRAASGQTFSSGSEPPYGNQEPSSFNRAVPIGSKGGRVGRGGRGRPTGRDGHQFGPPMPMMGSPFGPLGMPSPGSVQSLAPNMSPAPGPPMSPGVFIPPFSSPAVWPGARGVEMNMLGAPPGLPPVLPGPGFPPNLGMYFNQPGPGRGAPPNMCGPSYNALIPGGRGQVKDKANAGWVPPRTNAPPGKAPSRGEQNDYSQNFVDTGTRPQNFIRELELTSVIEDYPKLRELIQRKDEIVVKSASPPMYYKCDLREQQLSPEFFGTKFDVILIDPPWEEYVHRAPGVTDHMAYWTFEEIMNLKIEAIADTPSFVFLWVGDGVGLEQGRQCLKKWGFRRCEDICWVKTNKTNATPGLRHDSHTLFQHSKEHCLLGIKGTVRRSTDGHIIHANIDTDVIIAEEPPYGSSAKPEDMYRIIEHFALGRRRLELFGEDHNIRSGWLTVGKGLSSSNFSAEAYVRNFADRDGKVWQGGAGRNPPPDAPHLVVTTPEIEALRPKSPMKNQQQMQHQSASISMTTANSSNKRPAGNSPQNNNNSQNVNQEASSSNISNQGPWVPPMENFPGREDGHMISDNRLFDMYGYNAAFRQTNTEFL
ncbi:N6-adenosine-methyltransferase non-catalytic subunit MTB-like isoform X1 [Lycium ferocissimum]|uniref:N6-adenosine-methyltransferase non-catalytic subunit MTB-like isoform X1 n=1 Tax=Lycium ferocissimum TaxID=112874 RepID=UPI002815ADB3|nr:N6-adenosine-methyltransferase non-catalytic subunit MTB-like isoform X1 [Lycium ferocissimum]